MRGAGTGAIRPFPPGQLPQAPQDAPAAIQLPFTFGVPVWKWTVPFVTRVAAAEA